MFLSVLPAGVINDDDSTHKYKISCLVTSKVLYNTVRV